MKNSARRQGYTLLELIFTVALMGVMIVGIITGWITSSQNAYLNKMRLSAINQAQGKIEELRNTEYYRICKGPSDFPGYINTLVLGTNDTYFFEEDVVLEQAVALTENDNLDLTDDILGNLQIFVEEVDDSSDGLNQGDTDNFTRDFKKLIAKVTWTNRGRPYHTTIETFIEGEEGIDVDPESKNYKKLMEYQKETISELPKGTAVYSDAIAEDMGD